MHTYVAYNFTWEILVKSTNIQEHYFVYIYLKRETSEQICCSTLGSCEIPSVVLQGGIMDNQMWVVMISLCETHSFRILWYDTSKWTHQLLGYNKPTQNSAAWNKSNLCSHICRPVENWWNQTVLVCDAACYVSWDWLSLQGWLSISSVSVHSESPPSAGSTFTRGTLHVALTETNPIAQIIVSLCLLHICWMLINSGHVTRPRVFPSWSHTSPQTQCHWDKKVYKATSTKSLGKI